jgi:hypothetical protein
MVRMKVVREVRVEKLGKPKKVGVVYPTECGCLARERVQEEK